MTTVGKILVVLHLVLSVMFMAVAGAVFTAQRNWMKDSAEKAKQLAAVNAKLKDQQSEFERERTDLTTKNDGLKDQVTRLTGEKAALTTQVMTLQTDNEKLTAANDIQSDQAKLAAVEAQARKTEADLQREKNAVAFKSREELLKELQDTKDKLFGTELQMRDMVERHNVVLNDLKTIQMWNRSKGYLTDPKVMVVQSSPPPPLEGKIKDYYKEKKGDRELVEISLGSDDGLTIGHKLTVYNGQGRYLGQIRLTSVQPDKAVGIVTEKAKNTVIQKEDYVTTKL
jgi:chromosome segregation ATPase